MLVRIRNGSGRQSTKDVRSLAMPTAMPYMDSPSRERKRREREVSLSPRPPGRPAGRPAAGQDNRLPSIRTVMAILKGK